VNRAICPRSEGVRQLSVQRTLSPSKRRTDLRRSRRKVLGGMLPGSHSDPGTQSATSITSRPFREVLRRYTPLDAERVAIRRRCTDRTGAPAFRCPALYECCALRPQDTLCPGDDPSERRAIALPTRVKVLRRLRSNRRTQSVVERPTRVQAAEAQTCSIRLLITKTRVFLTFNNGKSPATTAGLFCQVMEMYFRRSSGRSPCGNGSRRWPV